MRARLADSADRLWTILFDATVKYAREIIRKYYNEDKNNIGYEYCASSCIAKQTRKTDDKETSS